MPCVRKSTISSALTAATATLSAINSATVLPVSSTGAPSAVSIVSSAAASSSSVVASPTTVAVASSAVSSAAAASSTATATSTSGNTTYAGVNIAGFDFGCSTDGTCTVDGITVPSTGAAQMQHFSDADNLNIFRLTTGWQYLINSDDTASGDLDATNFAAYDNLMQSCLDIGAKCVVDIHNYARFNGEIIGQGGPSNEVFSALWTSLATKYANNTNVFFGIMNEPHDLTVSTWAETVQAAVTAIRAVAPDHTLLLPGSSYSSAETLPTEAGPYLLNVTNPDGSTDNLVFDVHKYLDSDNSGTSTECVTNNIDDAFSPLATWLRTNNRQALLSETGGGNTASCEEYLCQQLSYLNENSDVFLGYVGWSAGGFDSTYALTLTPTGTTAADMVDTALMKSCIAR